MTPPVKIFALVKQGPGFYFVQVSPVEWHTVDLRAFKGNGSCTCTVFHGCCKFLLEHGSTKRWRCDHILAARDWMLENEVLASDEKIIEMPGNYDNPLRNMGVLPDGG